MITVKLNSKEFKYALKLVKKWGFSFSAANKTWTGSAEEANSGLPFETLDRAIEMGLVTIVTKSTDPAVVWMGNRSIEAFGSNF